jgi:hypothetical protein
MKKRILFSAFFLVLVFSLIAQANALETVVVAPGKVLVKTIKLNESDWVNGTVSVNPELGAFYVLGPEQESYPIYAGITNTKPLSFTFSANVSGTYTLRFWSMNLMQPMSVTLDYTVHRSGLGFYQGDFLFAVFFALLFVGALCVLFFYVRRTKDDLAKEEAIKETLPSTARGKSTYLGFKKYLA